MPEKMISRAPKLEKEIQVILSDFTSRRITAPEAVRRLYPVINRDIIFILRYLGISKSADQDDLLQDVMMRLLKYLHTYDPSKGPFLAWVSGIAHNLITNERFHARTDAIALPETRHGHGIGRDGWDFETFVSPADHAKHILQSSEVDSLLLQIPQRERMLMIYRFGYGYTVPELANILQKSERNIKFWLTEATKKLRALLNSNKKDPPVGQPPVRPRRRTVINRPTATAARQTFDESPSANQGKPFMSYNDAFFTELFRLLRYQALVEISAEREEHNRLRLELSLSSPKTTTRQSITTVPLLRSLLAPIFVFLGFSGKLQASMTLGVVSALLLCVPTQIGDRATFKPSMPNGISKARPSSNEALSYQDNSAAHWPELLITEPPFGSHLEATTVDLADPTSETPIFVELSTAISQSPDNADLNSTLDPGAWSTIGTLAFYSGAFGQNAGMLTFEAFDNTLNPGQTFAVSLFDDSRSLEAFDMNLLEQTELASVVSRDQLAWHSFAVSLELTGDVVSGLSSDDAGRFSSVIVGTNQSVGIVAEPSSSIGIALALIVIAIGRCWRIRKKGRYT